MLKSIVCLAIWVFAELSLCLDAIDGRNVDEKRDDFGAQEVTSTIFSCVKATSFVTMTVVETELPGEQWPTTVPETSFVPKTPTTLLPISDNPTPPLSPTSPPTETPVPIQSSSASIRSSVSSKVETSSPAPSSAILTKSEPNTDTSDMHTVLSPTHSPPTTSTVIPAPNAAAGKGCPGTAFCAMAVALFGLVVGM